MGHLFRTRYDTLATSPLVRIWLWTSTATRTRSYRRPWSCPAHRTAMVGAVRGVRAHLYDQRQAPGNSGRPQRWGHRTIVVDNEPAYRAFWEIESPDVLLSAAWAKGVDSGR